MYWHFFVLHTRQYRDFCEKIWGAFADHPRGIERHYDDAPAAAAPGTVSTGSKGTFIEHVPATEETRPTMRDAYNRMRALYEQVYGPPDPRVWTDVVATCGDSYSGYVPAASDIEEEGEDPFE